MTLPVHSEQDTLQMKSIDTGMDMCSNVPSYIKKNVYYSFFQFRVTTFCEEKGETQVSFFSFGESLDKITVKSLLPSTEDQTRSG